MPSPKELMQSIRKNQPDFYEYLRSYLPQVMDNPELGATDITAIMNELTKNIGTAATAYYGAKQQNQLLKTNLKLAEQGKPLIDPSSVAPTFRVDVDNPLMREVKNYLPFIILGGGALAVWMVYRNVKKKR